MNILNALKKLHPAAQVFVDYELQDDSDGNGVRIVKWNLPDPLPTIEDLQSASDLYDIEILPAVNIKQQIFKLESDITNRRLREAVLGIDNGWLANVNQQIADLRAQLT